VSDKLEKKQTGSLKEKAQYGIAFGLIASLLLFVGFPFYLLFFFGLFGYFVWKAFASPARTEVRGIFEFYLAAHEILRDDDRKWFGFEIQEAILAGEKILRAMADPPTLVIFTLGALHHKIGNHEVADEHLRYVFENEQSEEQNRLVASPELKNYARVLRKIEREPAEAPLTSAAVRALERARRNRGQAMLADSRAHLFGKHLFNEGKETASLDVTAMGEQPGEPRIWQDATYRPEPVSDSAFMPGFVSTIIREVKQHTEPKHKRQSRAAQARKPISEVLRDIYDREK
jgi:hypothetical protein